MIRFYEYVIYRLYSWRLEEKDDTPIATVIFTMVAIHFIQLMSIVSILGEFFPVLIGFFKQKKIFVFIIFSVCSLFYYLFVYNKKRWQGYIEQFKDETLEERKRGTFFVQLFTLGSVIFFFIIVIAIIFASEYKK